MTSDLVIGPLLRHVDPTGAAVWVETARGGTVTVRLDADGRTFTGPTFAVHGHHYALVQLSGLTPGSESTYRVLLDEVQLWPPEGSRRPASRVRTPVEEEVPRLAFGSCRTSVAHDEAGHRSHGVDALRSYGIDRAEGGDAPDWPDAMLLLGDQVYADEASPAMRDFIEARRGLEEPPGAEVRDYEEYAHLYSLAWGEPWLQWVLSNLPTMMIFDDHDVRDDWNTSWDWREQMEATAWWPRRIVAALASYWVYQHLGNLSPQERAEDEIWSELCRRQEARPGEEVELGDVLDAFAERVDQQPHTYRWSYARELGGARLVVVDSRAARVLEPGRRSMLDDVEMAWLDRNLRGDCSHLLIGTSLPFLLPRGLHHLEAWSEAVNDGAWGRWALGPAEQLRQAVDLEHWGAFGDGFRAVCAMVDEVVAGARGSAPSSVTFLSGDVHHSYVAEVEHPAAGRVLQLVCSPIRNPLSRRIRVANVILSHRVAGVLGGPLARLAKVARTVWDWDTVAGPWYDNNIAVLELREERMDVTWWTGEVRDGDHEHPRLETVASVSLDVPPAGQAHHRASATVRAASRRRMPRPHRPTLRRRIRVREGGDAS